MLYSFQTYVNKLDWHDNNCFNLLGVPEPTLLVIHIERRWHEIGNHSLILFSFIINSITFNPEVLRLRASIYPLQIHAWREHVLYRIGNKRLCSSTLSSTKAPWIALQVQWPHGWWKLEMALRSRRMLIDESIAPKDIRPEANLLPKNHLS